MGLDNRDYYQQPSPEYRFGGSSAYQGGGQGRRPAQHRDEGGGGRRAAEASQPEILCAHSDGQVGDRHQDLGRRRRLSGACGHS